MKTPCLKHSDFGIQFWFQKKKMYKACTTLWINWVLSKLKPFQYIKKS